MSLIVPANVAEGFWRQYAEAVSRAAKVKWRLEPDASVAALSEARYATFLKAEGCLREVWADLAATAAQTTG